MDHLTDLDLGFMFLMFLNLSSLAIFVNVMSHTGIMIFHDGMAAPLA